MIFQHTINQVLDGTKSQTRRLVKPGERLCEYPECTWVYSSNNRAKWQIGKTLAVQPGRGQKAVGRICITDIRRERVQDISNPDCLAEGISYLKRDWKAEYAELWDTIHTTPGTRWSDNPLVWVISFCLVEAE